MPSNNAGKKRGSLNKAMPSLTEWMERIGYKNIDKFRTEDNLKRDRLEILFKEIGLPYDRPEKIEANDIVKNTPIFFDILKRKGNEQCALRLIPLQPGFPKLRTWGKTLKQNLNWFFKQKINPDKYRVEIVPQKDTTDYSSIFIITEKGITGQITAGSHSQLTDGNFFNTPVNFYSDFKNWQFSNNDRAIRKICIQAVNKLKIPNKNKRSRLSRILKAKFTKNGCLMGYFEFVVWPQMGIIFIDYNRILYKLFNEQKNLKKEKADLAGTGAGTGKAMGPARIIRNPFKNNFKKGEILVCKSTNFDFIELIKKSKAIIAEMGGLLSHAAIIGRELKKPCVIMVKNATKKIKNGDMLEVDGDKGTINFLK